MVGLTLDGGLGEDLGGLLEGSGGQEGVRSQRRFGDPHQQLCAHCLPQRFAVLPDLSRLIAAVDLGVGIVQLQNVYHRAVQKLGVAGVLQADLAHHLADDDLDMLVVDVHALLAVHPQNLLDQVVVHSVGAPDSEHIMGVQGSVSQLRSGLDGIAVSHL